MRFWFSMMLLVAIAIGLALFPSVALQMMTIEIAGWHLEMKQGVFLALILLLIMVIKLLLWLLQLILKGPEQLVIAWRQGGKKRQENRQRQALTAWANGEEPTGAPFGSGQTVLPTWLADGLAALIHPSTKGKEEEAPLVLALRGKLLTEGGMNPNKTTLAQRRDAVERWRKAFPRSLLAWQRALALAEEGEEWDIVVEMIDHAPRGAPLADRQTRKGMALYRWAQNDPAHSLERLRQAAKLVDNDQVVIVLASQHRQGDDLKSARAVLLDALDKRDSLPIAKALADQEKELDNPLLTLHMLDKRCRKKASRSQRWLLVMLSQQAEDRERTHHHLRLLKQMPEGSALAWEIEAKLHLEAYEWESAARCYQQALEPIGEQP